MDALAEWQDAFTIALCKAIWQDWFLHKDDRWILYQQSNNASVCLFHNGKLQEYTGTEGPRVGPD